MAQKPLEEVWTAVLTPTDYRQMAMECRKQAQAAIDAELKTYWRERAAEWEALAISEERPIRWPKQA